MCSSMEKVVVGIGEQLSGPKKKNPESADKLQSQGIINWVEETSDPILLSMD